MTRLLTIEEIEHVINDTIPCFTYNSVITENVYSRIKNTLRQKLSAITIYPEMIDALKSQIRHHYYDSQIHPGESVGILTAQSIGERQTQLNLDSFHSTGISIATVVSGVPRFNELVNATKNPKNVITTIHLTTPCNTVQEIRNHAGIHIQHITLENVTTSISVHSKRNATDKWYTFFPILYPDILFDINTHFIRYTCNLEMLYTYKIRLETIASILSDIYEDVICVWSPDILGIIDVWFDANDIAVPDHTFINDYNKIAVCADNVIIPNLKTTTINGVEGIQQVFYTKNKNKQWYIEASGQNLKTLLALDFIDNTTTVSNNMWEILETLGIEATREFLVQEFTKVVSADSYINARHIQLLVDVMLYTGTISSISRYGVHKTHSGALTKCSFEESLDQILKAGVYGEKEQINGVSGAIICGKVSNIGTGLCDLVYKIFE